MSGIDKTSALCGLAREALSAEGSWPPSVDEVEFRLKGVVSQGWAEASLTDADHHLFARLRDLQCFMDVSVTADQLIADAHARLITDVGPPVEKPAGIQPG